MGFISTLGVLLSGALLVVSNDAQCTNPTVRREWRTLSRDERAAWISAVKCLAANPHNPDLIATVNSSISQIPAMNTSASFWDDISYMHMDLNVKIHQTGMFLPFHRWFVHSVEQAMIDKCGFSGGFPYWNWTIDAPDFYTSSWWQDSDPESGIGGWGDPDKDYEVQDGAFAGFPLAYPSYHPLRHQYTAQPFAAFAASSPTIAQFFNSTMLETYANSTFHTDQIAAIIAGNPGDYVGFQQSLDNWIGAHGSVHAITGGDLAGTCPATTDDCIPGNKWSPNSPLFFLHHAMIDKIWSDWQNLNGTSATAFYGGSVQAFDNTTYFSEYPNGAPPMLNTSSRIYTDNMFPGGTIGDVMNHTAGYLCYVYE
ncbi:Di-copper centre-containing protein [Lentinula edodes]|uniref:Di-copper centre-containing protein n=1 Tax=Lentinula edodes TaxID=5353 RepID=UPI001E8CCD99|nr:Di-copper centre-containing protein [Lentinula edodes]KAH7870975.1 Di-copper centre-containing protein [Lentinula edodes]